MRSAVSQGLRSSFFAHFLSSSHSRMEAHRVHSSSHAISTTVMSVANGAEVAPLSAATASVKAGQGFQQQKEGAPPASTPLSESEVRDLLDRINANQAYQIVLKEAQQQLDKALARNHELQVRHFWASDSVCELHFILISFHCFS